jgi:hypothetical protein
MQMFSKAFELDENLLVTTCDWCGQPFYQGRHNHRFCTLECGRRFHIAERRAALALYRSLKDVEDERGRLATEFIKSVGPEAKRRAADNELDYARARFKRSVERLFEREVAKIVKLIDEPSRYSVREWEKVRTYFEWIARKFANLVEQMEQARPLTIVDDTPAKDAVLKPGGGKPKLTESEVSQIKTLVNAAELRLEEIAKQFDVSPAEISGIKNERYWPLVEPRIVGRLDRYRPN